MDIRLRCSSVVKLVLSTCEYAKETQEKKDTRPAVSVHSCPQARQQPLNLLAPHDGYLPSSYSEAQCPAAWSEEFLLFAHSAWQPTPSF